MGKQQSIPFGYSPYWGSEFISTVEQFRKDCPEVTWYFNPWTGKERAPEDVKSDRLGRLILDPNDEIHADAERMSSALTKQEGGTHYKTLKIQPIEYIHANNIPYAEGSVIKYVTRWRDKGGIKDLEKARHFIDLLIELEARK